MITPLVNKTHFSIQEAFSKPDTLAKKAKELGYTSCGLIDNQSVSGAVEFSAECKKAGIKPILGCDFSDKEKKLIIIARNLAGWKQLIKLVTKNFELAPQEEDNPSTFVYPPDLAGSSLIVISSDSSFLLSDHSYHIDSVALKPSYYIEPSDISSFLVLRSLELKQPLAVVKGLYTEDLSFPDQDVWNSFNAQQIVNLSAIDELCEPYSILQDPKLPHFECPNGLTEIQYLTDLCREGWKKLINGKVAKSEHEKYAARVKQELRVIELANLSGYFLIVWDFIKQARDKEVLVGPGRGSAGGCLVSYLLGITLIDPIPYDLLFSRFYNSSRSYPKHVSFGEYKFVDDWRNT